METLKALIKDWEEQAVFLNTPHGSASDRTVGQAYATCAMELSEDIKPPNKEAIKPPNKVDSVCACTCPKDPHNLGWAAWCPIHGNKHDQD